PGGSWGKACSNLRPNRCAKPTTCSARSPAGSRRMIYSVTFSQPSASANSRGGAIARSAGVDKNALLSRPTQAYERNCTRGKVDVGDSTRARGPTVVENRGGGRAGRVAGGMRQRPARSRGGRGHARRRRPGSRGDRAGRARAGRGRAGVDGRGGSARGRAPGLCRKPPVRAGGEQRAGVLPGPRSEERRV